MRKRHGYFQVSAFQNREISDQDSYRRIFSLSADAPCPSERISQNQRLRLSSFVQQETHQVSAADSARKSLQDIVSKKGTSQNNLPHMRCNNAYHQDQDKAA